MKSIISVLIGVFLVMNVGLSQEKALVDSKVSVLAKGQKDLPLFGVKKMGIGNNMELQLHPLFFFLDPHIGLKKYWGDRGGWHLSSRHTLNYPTLLLKMMSREGTGGVLPNTSVIPQIISTQNEILATQTIGNQFYLAASLGVELAITFGEANFPTIDLPFVYRRTAVYHDHILPYVGVEFGGQLSQKIDFEVILNIYKFINDNAGFTVEDKAVLFWKKSPNFGIKAGVASVLGKYPFGYDFRWIPLLDFVWMVGR